MNEHWEVLPRSTAETWPVLRNISGIDKFYLAGGTGLALQIGHRLSRDLDFFSADRFEVEELISDLSALGNFQLEMKAKQSVTGIFNQTKLSFLGYPYSLLKKTIVIRAVRVADIADIACMKIDAISTRGAKRDFIDLFFIAQKAPLGLLLKSFEQKYASLRYNLMHVKKSLVYFDDAEADMMPEMLKSSDWATIKAFFQEEIKKLI